MLDTSEKIATPPDMKLQNHCMEKRGHIPLTAEVLSTLEAELQ